MRTILPSAIVLCLLTTIGGSAQQQTPPPPRVQKTPPAQTPSKPQPAPEQTPQEPETRQETPARPAEPERQPQPQRPPEPEREQPFGQQRPPMPYMKYDMTERPPVVTHHQIRLGGRTLAYSATAGRLPIKDPSGKIEAEMFFVAYALDGADPSTRPVTFAFNGGPGSASIWLHMGALGPRKVVLQPEGWLPAPPYRLMDNPYTPLDRTDLVLVDAIGTGYSRPADTTTGRKFWGVQGDIEAFGEFIRLYISRYERWSSPLYLLGESYGTTRSAGIAGYLSNRGISFNGIALLSTVLNFESLEFTKTNDLPYILTLPTYTMIAAYHKKLPADLMQDLAKTRAEVEHWASNDYALALAKGDALTPQERQAVIQQLARFTGLKPEFIDQANLRIDVQGFTHNLLADQKLRVGRLDGRYTGPDPEGFLETRFYDPTSANTQGPFTAVFNDYLRRELNYKVDMPYYTSAPNLGFRGWEWGSAIEGFPDTAAALRAAMVKNRYLQIMVMEGYYDLATPYYAANYTMDHLNLPPEFRNNISYVTYDSGHMVYLQTQSLEKMKRDFTAFVDKTMPRP